MISVSNHISFSDTVLLKILVKDVYLIPYNHFYVPNTLDAHNFIAANAIKVPEILLKS